MGEEIKKHAKKCKHCGEILDITLRAAQTAQANASNIASNSTTVVVNQINGGYGKKQWSRLVAGLLSFFIP
jgi:Fe2+ or Zn2+ uptake regulation protein